MLHLIRRFISVALTASFGLLAAAPAYADNLTIFAASSLKSALDTIDELHKTRHSDSKLTFVYAASSTLAKQIQHGAPADLFLSASPEWMDYVEQRDLIESASRRNLLANRLSLIAPADSAIHWTAPDMRNADQMLISALGKRRLSVADPSHVPAGRYAQSALEWMGLWPGITPQLARAENVRVALAYVALGECPLGIVYSTDAHAEPRVSILAEFPAEAHPAIIYPAAIVKGGNSTGAQSFLDFLESADAQQAFLAQGFTLNP